MANKKCLNCGGYKTISLRKLLFIIGLSTVLVALLLAFLVFPLFFIPVGGLEMIAALAMPKKKWLCRTCGQWFNV